MIRIVAGRFGGRRIATPPGRATRPTSDRVREAIFSMLGPLDATAALDLYAGSGALGIEALSRGATTATFVDADPRAAACVKSNLERLGAEALAGRRDALRFPADGADAALVRADALEFLERAASERRRYDVVFLDPPYSSAASIAARLAGLLPAVLSRDARIVSESDKRAPLTLPFPLARERVYGDTRVAIHLG